MSCLCKDEAESVPLRPCSKPFGLVFISKHKKDNMLLSNTAADDTNRVRIKLCGMTQEDDVLTAVQAGADALVAGNAVFSAPCPEEMIHALKNL